MSSNSVGRTFFIASRMPSDSSWKTPVESPRASISKVFASSIGIVADVELDSPRERSMISIASSITSRLRRPRKSIFSRPISSIGPIEYWVTILYWRSPLAPLPLPPAGALRSSASCSGTISCRGRSAITTAAAWIELLRMIPSRPWATSMIRFASGSAS